MTCIPASYDMYTCIDCSHPVMFSREDTAGNKRCANCFDLYLDKIREENKEKDEI